MPDQVSQTGANEAEYSILFDGTFCLWQPRPNRTRLKKSFDSGARMCKATLTIHGQTVQLRCRPSFSLFVVFFFLSALLFGYFQLLGAARARDVYARVFELFLLLLVLTPLIWAAVGLRPRQWKFPVQSISDARLDAAHPWLHRVFFNVSVPDPVQGANDSLIVMWQAKDGSIAESLVRQLPHRTPANVANPKPDQPVPGAVARPDVWRSGPLVGIRLGSSPAPWHRYHASSVPWYRYESDSSAVNDALPDRCFYCNASANGYRFKRRFRYVKNAVGRAFISTLFLSNPGAALGTEAWMTKEVEVQLGLCEEHERECVPWPGTKAWIFISMPTFFMFLISIRANQPWIGFFLLVAAAIWWIKSRIRKPVGHLEGLDDQAVWISGAGNAFLDSLPTA